LLASACGGSSAAKVAQVATTGSAPGSRAGPLAFAACVRRHGVRNFPYSDTDGRIHAAGIDKSSPAFRAARRSCRALEPGGRLGEQASTLLQQTVARVRRVHGRARRAHVSRPNDHARRTHHPRNSANRPELAHLHRRRERLPRQTVRKRRRQFLLEALAPRKVTRSTSRLAAASADALEVPLATIGKQRAAGFLCCLEPR
jgi:hypothetical protein